MTTPLLHAPKRAGTKQYAILNGHGYSIGPDSPHRILVPFDGLLTDPLFQVTFALGKTVDVELAIQDGAMVTTYKKTIKEGASEVPDFSFPVKRGQVLSVKFLDTTTYVFTFVLERS